MKTLNIKDFGVVKQSGRHYKPETMAGRLEAAMLEKNITSIPYPLGPLDKYRNRTHSAGLEMERDQRAYRTVDVKRMTKDQLQALHDYELKYMDRFLIGPGEIKKKLRIEIPPQVFLNQVQMDYLEKFNEEHKPVLDRRFLDHLIPPYFVYDYDFDGMEYVHSWDKSVWYAPWEMPKRKSDKADEEY